MIFRTAFNKKNGIPDLLIYLIIRIFFKSFKFVSFQIEVEVCSSCSEFILDRTLLTVNSRFWHTDCLKCSQCLVSLKQYSSCFVKDNVFFCKQCYNRFVSLHFALSNLNNFNESWECHQSSIGVVLCSFPFCLIISHLALLYFFEVKARRMFGSLSLPLLSICQN